MTLSLLKPLKTCTISLFLRKFQQQVTKLRLKISNLARQLSAAPFTISERASLKLKLMKLELKREDNIPFRIPLADKDNISTDGIHSQLQLQNIYNYEPIFDATVCQYQKRKAWVSGEN